VGTPRAGNRAEIQSKLRILQPHAAAESTFIVGMIQPHSSIGPFGQFSNLKSSLQSFRARGCEDLPTILLLRENSRIPYGSAEVARKPRRFHGNQAMKSPGSHLPAKPGGPKSKVVLIRGRPDDFYLEARVTFDRSKLVFVTVARSAM
jgi:hypothetical protein